MHWVARCLPLFYNSVSRSKRILLLVVSIAFVTLGLSLTLHAEPARAVAVVIAAGSICYAWVMLRKNLQSRFGVVVLGVGLSILALGCAWSALNIARLYLYNPATEGAAIYSWLFQIVCQTQVVLQRCEVVVAAGFVVLLLIAPFRSRHVPLVGE